MALLSGAAVAFSGEGAGEGPLSWGQQEMWTSMTRYGHAMPVGGIKPLPPGTTVEDIADELRYLMSRYAVMRTRLRFMSDGTVRQVVAAKGEIVLEIVNADDAEQAAQATEARYRETPFDYRVDWPVRMAVIQRRGVLTHMVVIMHHLAMDGFSARIMMTEVAARETAPIAGMDPLAQAHWQQSAAGQRQNEAALRYLESTLETMPEPFPRRLGMAAEPRIWEGSLNSLALYQAIQAICAHTCSEPAPVMLTAYATAIARVTGQSSVVLRPVVSNRFRPGLADVVCPLTQPGICVLDVGGVPFPEALRRTERSAMRAYKHAYCDPVAARKVAEGRDPDSFFNDRRVMHRPAGRAPSPEQIREALPHSTFEWTGGRNDPSARLFVQIEDVPDTTVVSVVTDTAYLPQADTEALLREMESVAVDAAMRGFGAGSGH